MIGKSVLLTQSWKFRAHTVKVHVNEDSKDVKTMETLIQKGFHSLIPRLSQTSLPKSPPKVYTPLKPHTTSIKILTTKSK